MMLQPCMDAAHGFIEDSFSFPQVCESYAPTPQGLASLCVHFSFAIILMGKRELVALLFVFLLCGSSSQWHGFVCSLWYFPIILTIYDMQGLYKGPLNIVIY